MSKGLFTCTWSERSEILTDLRGILPQDHKCTQTRALQRTLHISPPSDPQMLNIGYYNNTILPRGFETLEMKAFTPPLLVKSTENVSNPFISYKLLRRAPQVALVVKPTCRCRRQKRRGFSPWVRKIPWRTAWQPTPVFLPGESHGQRSLEGHSPQGYKESDMTEGLSTYHL